MKNKTKLIKKIEWQPINKTNYKFWSSNKSQPETFKHVWFYGLLCSIPILGHLALILSGLEWWKRCRRVTFIEEEKW